MFIIYDNTFTLAIVAFDKPDCHARLISLGDMSYTELHSFKM